MLALTLMDAVGRWSASSALDIQSVSDDTTPVGFSVRAGVSAAEIGDDLQRAGLIRSATVFRMLAEQQGVSGQLRVGEYELRRNLSAIEILDVLSAGRTRRSGRLTIPEGWRAEQVASVLESEGLADGAAFLDAVAGRSTIFGVNLPPGATSFEGYLFPDTYEFGRDPSAPGILRRMVDEHSQKVGPALQAKAAERGLSLHQLMTLASIIEREAVMAEERADIAAVFHNRLDRGMRLQADPTAQYALIPFGRLDVGDTYWKRSLTADDLRVPSPYNTYVAAGLPPGPICNPGLASIEAAANPSQRSWLYFVSRGDGTHLFASTLDEHLRNVGRVATAGA